MSLITVREYAKLRLDRVKGSLDEATISPQTFAWLSSHAFGPKPTSGRLVRLAGPRTLVLGSYVGVLQAPGGEQIEILPKVTHEETSAADARRLLLKMLSRAMRLKPKQVETASVQAAKGPLTEWLAHGFVTRAADLLRKGLRQTYTRVQSIEPALRGRLDLARQIRAAPGGGASFHVEHDVFSFDRPEHRLIRLAVDKILAFTRSPQTWRVARELGLLLGDVPPSRAVEDDLRAWSGKDRLLAHYAEVRPWCELIVQRRSPFTTLGLAEGAALLFPMEKVFEAYVGALLAEQLPAGRRLRSQVSYGRLCSWDDAHWFPLKPDFLVEGGEESWVLDAKWKLLHGRRKSVYGLDQDDFYQMLAYGHAYLKGAGEMFLLYPKVGEAPARIGPFALSESLRVTALTVDLERDRIVGLWAPQGAEQLLTA